MKKLLFLPLLLVLFITAACSSDNPSMSTDLEEDNNQVINEEAEIDETESVEENVEEEIKIEEENEVIDENNNIKEVESDDTIDERSYADDNKSGQIIPLDANQVENKTIDEEELIFCPMDVKECPDGSFVSRVAPSCDFSSCPEVTEE
ncbi:MAG: hypothetical protein PF488_02530 [Patescibacteria group bacterium]|jgi:hypothetical protein|nr:hypothetical protein [Patescibacteria group bacterium]